MSEALRKAAKQAISALSNVAPTTSDQVFDFDHARLSAIVALRAALAEPEQSEPVACKHEWFRTGAMEPGEHRCIKCGTWSNPYLPRREPLSDEQIKQIHEELCNTTSSNYKTMARAIEQAHGITGGKTKPLSDTEVTEAACSIDESLRAHLRGTGEKT